MAKQYIVDIGQNDTLPSIIRKCNHNFKIIISSQSRQLHNNIRSSTDDIYDEIDEEKNKRIESDTILGGKIDGAIDDIGDINDQIDAISSRLIDPLDLYPIGSIYISTAPTDPATFIGGTWNQIKDTFIVANGNIFNTASGTIDSTTGSDPIIPWISVNMWERIA